MYNFDICSGRTKVVFEYLGFYHDNPMNVFQERNSSLKARVSHLEQQIANLQKDSVGQLKGRLGEVSSLHLHCTGSYQDISIMSCSHVIL